MAATGDLPGFAGFSLGGSVASGLADAASDLDLHVYVRDPLASATERASRLAELADAGSLKVGITSWGLEDHLRVGGLLVELVYVDLGHLEAEVERAYGEGLGGEAFVTAQFDYLASGRVLHDPAGALGRLRGWLLAGYPEPTRQRIVRDTPFLLETYLVQLRGAQARGDLLYVQHRRYTVQTVFFNLLFALNRRYHPGEKRLLAHAAGCEIRPPALERRWNEVARMPADDPTLAPALQSLSDELCGLAED